MTRIARDEMRHLTLSWEVHAWAKSRLQPQVRARLLEAQQAECVVLAGETRIDPVASLVLLAGLPRAADSRVLVDAIASQLRAAS